MALYVYKHDQVFNRLCLQYIWPHDLVTDIFVSGDLFLCLSYYIFCKSLS